MISLEQKITEKIIEHKLPSSYLETVQKWLQPISKEVADLASAPKRGENNYSFVLGVQGTQGSGKSTSSEFIKQLLEEEHQLNVAVLSIDDFYLTLEEREALSKTRHPLLKTRGVPGTHDVDLAIETISTLSSLKATEKTHIPRFDKAIDDRAPIESWTSIEGPVDVIILEGWCIGLKAEREECLIEAINSLEATEDHNGEWRHFVNQSLSQRYQELFSLIHKQLVLNAPSFECVYTWRLNQEHKLIERIRNSNTDTSKIKTLSDAQVERFISHYQRLTEHALKTMPKIADWCLWLDANQSISKITTNESLQAKKDASLVITDLDGTLLDHHNYSWQPASSAIEYLTSHNIPIVINTSKTFEEVVSLQADIGLKTPFIVENGSALYFPKVFIESNGINLKHATELEDHYQILFGENRETISNIVYGLKEKYNFKFSGYSEWTVTDVMARTGLSESAASASINRKFSEPIVWEDSEEALENFKEHIAEHHLTTLKGGRFLHILGMTDKAKPIVFLEDLLSELKNKKLSVICLGDSFNDAQMLAVADFPVWIKSPSNTYPPYTGENKPLYTKEYGPHGWNQAIATLFSTEF